MRCNSLKRTWETKRAQSDQWRQHCSNAQLGAVEILPLLGHTESGLFRPKGQYTQSTEPEISKGRYSPRVWCSKSIPCLNKYIQRAEAKDGIL